MEHRYQAADVAACIINKAIDSGKYISNLQLQKLLYYCQCLCLKVTGERLFDDDIVAWQYGPVVKSVYYTYSYRGASDIKESDITTFDRETGQIRNIVPLTGKALDIVNETFGRLHNRSAWDLVYMSHRAGGAWDKVYNYGGEGRGYGDVIPVQLMQEELGR